MKIPIEGGDDFSNKGNYCGVFVKYLLLFLFELE